MRTEYVKFTKEHLETIAKFNARLALIGSFYQGEINDQTIEWHSDGSISVFTKHTPKGS